MGDSAGDREKARRYWDGQAALFDEEPDHGLQDPAVAAAWTRLLRDWLPTPGAIVLDMGCGTGSLSLLLAGLGHQVTGIDLSPAMVAIAERKARRAGCDISFHVGDAVNPAGTGQPFDAIVCRHLLWALPEPAAVLRRWLNLVRSAGRLLLVEGFWHTGGGLHAGDLMAACRRHNERYFARPRAPARIFGAVRCLTNVTPSPRLSRNLEMQRNPCVMRRAASWQCLQTSSYPRKRAAPGRRLHPGAAHQWWFVTHVLAMATFEIGDPVAFVILMKTDDLAFHLVALSLAQEFSVCIIQ